MEDGYAMLEAINTKINEMLRLVKRIERRQSKNKRREKNKR